MQEEEYRWAYLSGWVSIVVNIGLAALKYIAGITTGSLALLADAWHTVSDTLSSVAVLFAARTAGKPADEEHPFGHGRADLVFGVGIGVLIGTVGLNFAVDSVAALADPQPVVYGTFAVVSVAVSLVGKEALAQFSFFASRKSRMESLRADAWHHRSDALTSAIVLSGIVFAGRIPWIDSVLGLIVAGFLLVAACKVIWNSARPLFGESPNGRTIAGIRATARRVSPLLENVHHVHIHRYGRHTEMTCHVNVDEKMSVGDAHSLVDDFEQALREDLGIEPTVHIEPQPDETPRPDETAR